MVNPVKLQVDRIEDYSKEAVPMEVDPAVLKEGST